MIKQEKLNNLTTTNELLDKKYGKEGTESRAEFNAKAQAWYYAEVLKQERKKQGISQDALNSFDTPARSCLR